jgi:four helix bundle protein
MASYKELTVWKESMNLAVLVYRITQNFPYEEKKGLSDQMRRASVSVSSNIAEGYGRLSDSDFTHFLKFSLGSAYELDTQIELSRQLAYIDDATYSDLSQRIISIEKMLSSLIYRRTNGLDSFAHK